MDCCPPGSSVCGDSPGKNTAVGFHALLQGIFPTQGSNPGLLHCRWILTFPATIWQITKFLLYQTMQHYKLRCFGLLPRTSKNMFLDFYTTCIILQNTLLCCPGLAYGKTVHLGRVISSSVQFSHSVVPDSLWPHESQHARPPCPSPTPGVTFVPRKRLPDWPSLELSPSVESCGCGLGPSPVRLG